jgi:hypothetical protein
MIYLSEGKEFIFHYQELKDKYNEFCEMDNDEFCKSSKDALHLAIIICYLKELPTSAVLGDTGIIHELTHLVCGIELSKSIEELRNDFMEILKLA